MTSPHQFTYGCPAKLNLALSVGTPTHSPLGSYHPICSWMVMINLYDDLALETCEGESTYDIDWAADAPQPSPIDWPIDADLAVRAHRLLEERVGRALGVKMTLRKRIAVGAGLAGGSSDAAGMLVGLNRLFQLNLPAQQLIELAMKLGSDMGFFFTSGSAIVSGFGEKLQPLAHRRLDFALVSPDLHCPTGAVYRSFDHHVPIAVLDEGAVNLVTDGKAEPFNDLTEPACHVEPHLAELRKAIRSAINRTAHVTGSGAALFVTAQNADEAQSLAEQIQIKCKTPALAVHTVERPPAKV
jgi:4-diphosphocytidyl-2-C-methyl-D-erythritol kinase